MDLQNKTPETLNSEEAVAFTKRLLKEHNVSFSVDDEPADSHFYGIALKNDWRDGDYSVRAEIVDQGKLQFRRIEPKLTSEYGDSGEWLAVLTTLLCNPGKTILWNYMGPDSYITVTADSKIYSEGIDEDSLNLSFTNMDEDDESLIRKQLRSLLNWLKSGEDLSQLSKFNNLA